MDILGVLLLLLNIVTIFGQDCVRHRKEWNQLTQTEKDTYFNAFKLLIDSGVVQALSTAHNELFPIAHGTEEFWPWHRQYLFAFESQIRALGPEYECFSLPYWDWSDSTDRWTVISDVENNHWFNDCPSTDASLADYDPSHPLTTCLLRNVDTINPFTDYATIMYDIDANPDYFSMRPLFEAVPHGTPHVRVGGNMGTTFSPDDPLFYLHHTFVDYVWALWQDCNGYDGVEHTSQSEMYWGDVETWLSYGSASDYVASVRVKGTTDISTMNGEGYSFEKGKFWTNARVDDTDYCNHQTNGEWFVDTTEMTVVQSTQSGDDQAWEDITADGYTGKERRALWTETVCKKHREVSGNYCEEPVTFEDCWNESGDADIVVTLETLLSKQGLTECMKDTRRKFFEWAKMNGNLRGLCDGCYDSFCVASEKTQMKCVGDAHGQVISAARMHMANDDNQQKYGTYITENHSVFYTIYSRFKLVILFVFLVVFTVIHAVVWWIHHCKSKEHKYATVRVDSDTENGDVDSEAKLFSAAH